MEDCMFYQTNKTLSDLESIISCLLSIPQIAWVPSHFCSSPVHSEESDLTSQHLFWEKKKKNGDNRSYFHWLFSSVQSLSHVRLYDPMNCSTPGLPIHHQPQEFTQTHVHRVSDAIQPSHPLSSPSPPAPNPSQHQSLFQ